MVRCWKLAPDFGEVIKSFRKSEKKNTKFDWPRKGWINYIANVKEMALGINDKI